MSNDSSIPIELQFPEKMCRNCKEVKPRTEFGKTPRTRDGLGPWCKTCQSAYGRKRRSERHLRPYEPVPEKKICTKCNVEKPITEFFRKSQSKDGFCPQCKTCANSKTKEWRDQNKEHIANTLRKYRQSERGREIIRAIAKRERQTEGWKLKRRVEASKRRALKRKNGGTYTAGDVKLMLRNQRGRCWYCEVELDKYEIDHRVPLSRGGRNDPSNLVLTCPKCNRAKHDKLPHEWSDRLL